MLRNKETCSYSLLRIQKLIFDLIEDVKEISVDKLIIKSALPASKVASVLLMLEFEGMIQSLPGKLYTTY